MKQAIAYYRVSTDLQREEKTIQIQQNKVREFSKKNDYKLIAEFSDDGVSGSLQQRDGLRQMLELLEKTEAQYVIIYKLDRLARDLYIQEGLIKEIARYDKQLISTLEPDLDGSDPFRKAFRQMLGVFAEFEKAMIALRLEGGRERKAQLGGWHGGDIYGYRSVNGKLRVHQEESKVVSLIYNLRNSQGFMCSDIAESLTKQGYKTRRGHSVWRVSTIRKILNNPIYKSGKIRYKGKLYKSPVKTLV